MAVKNYVLAIPLTSIASSTVGGTYAAINPTGLPNACFELRITNNSNKDITISYDGINDHEYLPTASAALQIYGQQGAQPSSFIANFAKGTVIWVKGTAGTGNIYLSGFYLPTNTVV